MQEVPDTNETVCQMEDCKKYDNDKNGNKNNKNNNNRNIQEASDTNETENQIEDLTCLLCFTAHLTNLEQSGVCKIFRPVASYQLFGGKTFLCQFTLCVGMLMFDQ